MNPESNLHHQYHRQHQSSSRCEGIQTRERISNNVNIKVTENSHTTMANWTWVSGAIITPVSVQNESANKPKKKKRVSSFVDHRPIVSELLAEHSTKIRELQVELEKDELYDPKKHDELWMLRFLLSHKKSVNKALAAAKETLKFRKKYNLDHIDIRAVAPQEMTEASDAPSRAYQSFLQNGVTRESVRLVVPDEESGGVVVYFSIKDIDTHTIGNMDQEDWVAGMVFVNEWQFQWNDHITRATGRLTKSVHVIDVSDIHLSMRDSTTQGKYATASKALQNCYPQGVQKYFVCNAPFWIQGPWKIFKPLLPVRVVSKLDFLNPKKYKADLDQILRYVPVEELPSQFGGDVEN